MKKKLWFLSASLACASLTKAQDSTARTPVLPIEVACVKITGYLDAAYYRYRNMSGYQ